MQFFSEYWTVLIGKFSCLLFEFLQIIFKLPRLIGCIQLSLGEADIHPLSTIHYPITHRPVTALAFIPHPPQRRVTGVHEVNNAHIGLGGVLTV